MCAVCVSEPCQNQGTCQVIGADEYACTCVDGVAGDNCEKGLLTVHI
jgi:hypothetical protein